MVKYHDDALDRVFGALSDPTRRALLARLSQGKPLSVSELAGPLPISLPAVMKHLDALAGAGLITRNKTGRTVSCEMDAAPMQTAIAWLEKYQKFWSERLDRLAEILESTPEDPSWKVSPPADLPPNPVSPSKSTSRRTRTKSSPRGRSPRK